MLAQGLWELTRKLAPLFVQSVMRTLSGGLRRLARRLGSLELLLHTQLELVAVHHLCFERLLNPRAVSGGATFVLETASRRSIGLVQRHPTTPLSSALITPPPAHKHATGCTHAVL